MPPRHPSEPILEKLKDPLRPPLPETYHTAPQMLTARAVRRGANLAKRWNQDEYGGDPAKELMDYVNHYWVQELAALRTRCWRCKKDSPIVHAPVGAMLFGATPKFRGQLDVTRAVIEAFAEVGWKFQLRKSYCPDCKDMGKI